MLQLLLVLAAGLLGVVTNFATDGRDTPLPMRLLEQAAVPGLVLILVVLLVGHFAAYRLENPPPPEFAWEPGRSPYPGLASFHEDEAAVFFGRTAQTTEAMRRLNGVGTDPHERFLAVIGASGSGKSSLVQAGILPRLRGRRWNVLPVMVPGTDPVGALAKVLAAATDHAQTDAYARRIRRDSGELLALLHRIRREAGGTRRTVLVVDQLEELVTLSGDRDRSLFLGALREALRGDRHLRVVATLRVEFLGDLLNGEAAELFTNPLALGALSRQDLVEIIERPAEAADFHFEDGLVEHIAADTGSGDALPLLAYLLQELHIRADVRGNATEADYRALGGVEGALTRHADQVTAELRSESDLDHILRVLLRFVTVTSGDATRRRVRLAELDERDRHVVDAFVDARLLVSDVHEGGPVAQVTHEALFRQWAPLRQQVEAHTERLRQRAELERWAGDWEGSARHPDYLLTGTRLTTAERWLEALRENGQDTPALTAFVDASRRRDHRFLRRVSLSIAEYVLAGVEEHPELAVLLTLAALEECEPVLVVRGALLSALAHTHCSAVLTGHGDTVRNLTWSPDGTRIATASRDGTARLWDTRGGLLRELRGHMGMVEMAAWSPDSRRVATASRDHTVRVWDVDTGETLLRFTDATDVVRGVAWSPDGRYVAAASRDRVIRIWEADTGRLSTQLTGHTDNVLGIRWSPDGTRLATASHDRTVIVWDVAEARQAARLTGHRDFVEGVSWDPDGTRIATASGDHTVRIWNAVTGEQTLLLRGHRDRVWNVEWSPDGRLLATASADRTARVFTADDAEERVVLRGHTDAVWGVAWSPDGTCLATGSEDATARLWEMEPRTVEHAVHDAQGAAVNAVTCQGGVLAAGGEDGTVRVWERGADRPVHLRDHAGTVRDAALAPDGKVLVSGGTDRRALLWNLETGETLLELDHDGAIVEAVAWSPDGDLVATGAQDRSIRVWDARDGSLLTVLRGHQDWVVGLAWSPSGRMIASCSDDRTARVWDLTTGRERLVLTGHENWVDSVVWAPDETRLATSSADWTVRVWTLATGQVERVLTGHGGRVPAVAWSPDGARLATASHDRTVRVWDMRSEAEPVTVGVHRDRALSVTWSGGSRLVASGSADGTVRVWDADMPLEELTRVARRRTFRALTPEERRAHLLAVGEE
ncbi:eIF2A-related protein [Nocardiopsis tropica]|uniref:WD40 repeat domain-containing protein n=1 Tax=Nocardiopsis tropica TaxID=109330 RepID=A0ABU7KI90_9ACTN|nr:WD40 repeat domain-containing protein [Nocardiopsis umidischolae]MEE2049009.1 WD40 repeat domain-containing protein [Nocardiopsis umidischolae]